MDVIAHRGWSERFPENSHAAFAAALTAPCAGIELDLRLAADGTVVVCHDATLARFGGNRVPIARQDLATLRRQVVLPTLTEVLARYTVGSLLLELKPHGGTIWTNRLVDAVCRLAEPHRERVFILAFSPAVLARVAARHPQLRRIRNTEQVPADPHWFARQTGTWGIDAAYQAWQPATVALARAHGFATAAYTVNRIPDLARCQRLGLDLVITNRPRWASIRLGHVRG
jgi:glycerophosphoryl diester phosphodiesterase